MKDLDDLRKKIDLIDAKLIEFLAKREEIIRMVGRFKKERNILPLDEKRRREVFESRLLQAKSLGLPQEFVKKIWDLIHQEALRIEEEL